MAEKAQGGGDCAKVSHGTADNQQKAYPYRSGRSNETTRIPTGLPVDPQRKRGGIEAVTARRHAQGAEEGSLLGEERKGRRVLSAALSRFDLIASVPGIPLSQPSRTLRKAMIYRDLVYQLPGPFTRWAIAFWQQSLVFRPTVEL